MLGHHEQELSAVPPAGGGAGARAPVRHQPPLVAVAHAGRFHIARSHPRLQRFGDPARGEDPFSAPDAVVQIQVAEPRQVLPGQVQPPFGVGETGRRVLPVIGLNADRMEDVLLGVRVHLPARGLEDDVGQELAHAAAVEKYLPRLLVHRLIDDVLHPVVARLHRGAGVARVGVGRRVLVPVEPRRHGQEIAQPDGALPIVQAGDGARVEILQDGDVDAGDLAARDGDADRRGRHALGDRLQRVQIALPVPRVPVRIVVIVRPARLVFPVEQLHVVVVVGPVEHDVSVTDDEHPVDVSVPPRGELRVECLQRGGVHPLLLRTGRGPRVSGPGRLRSRVRARRHDNGGRQDPGPDDSQLLSSRSRRIVCARPTLMIQSGADSCDDPRGSEGLEKFFTGRYSRLLLDGIGHFPNRENPIRVAEALINLIQDAG